VRAGGALLVLLGLVVPAYAQVSRKAEPRSARSGWDGRPVTHTCHADVIDLQGLKATLVEHEKVRIGFKNKIRHGVFSGGELSGGRIRNAAPASLVDRITRHLSELANAGEALALVYDMGMVGQQYALCVWLFSANGIDAAATVPIEERSPLRSTSAATTVRSGLDVEGRAVARVPQIRRDPGAERPALVERASQQLLEAAWSLLMPAAIARKLHDTSAKRLLILPVSDIGFVPFAALPLGGERLIDRFALVLLPDLEALLGLSLDAPAGMQRETRAVVVGDPDLSQDRQWKFPPLPGRGVRPRRLRHWLAHARCSGRRQRRAMSWNSSSQARTPASSILRRTRYRTPSIRWTAAFWRLPAITGTGAISRASCFRATLWS
jgi:hypothetical protein